MNTQFEYFTVDYTTDPPPPWVDVDGVRLPPKHDGDRTWTPILFEGKREWPEAEIKEMPEMKPGWYRFIGYAYVRNRGWMHEGEKVLMPIPFNDLEIKT